MAYDNNRAEDIIIEDATISGRNFSGKKFGDGRRSFGVIIDSAEDAQKLMDIGWNVRVKEGYNPGDPERYMLNVAIRFDVRPPQIYCIAGGKKRLWGEAQIDALDHARIQSVDMVIHPRYYTDKTGHDAIKAYLSEMYVTIEQSRLAGKYAYLDDEDDCPFD